METAVRSHGRMLERVSGLSRVLGWTLIVGGLLAAGADTWMVLRFRLMAFDPTIPLDAVLRDGMEALGAVLTGVAVLGVVQFIRYALEDKAEPGWILRNGHILLGLIAVFMLASWAVYDLPRSEKGLSFLLSRPGAQAGSIRSVVAVIVAYGTTLLPAVTKALAFLGIAVTLRAVLPVMAEAKTLA